MSCMLGGTRGWGVLTSVEGCFYSAVLRMYGGMRWKSMMTEMRADFDGTACSRRYRDNTCCTNACFLLDSSPCSGNAGRFVPRE